MNINKNNVIMNVNEYDKHIYQTQEAMLRQDRMCLTKEFYNRVGLRYNGKKIYIIIKPKFSRYI